MALDSLGYFGVLDQKPGRLVRLRLDRFSASSSSTAAGKSSTFRKDHCRQRLVVHEDDVNSGERAAFMGWEVADAAALDELAATLESEGRPRPARAAVDLRMNAVSRT